MEHGVFPLPGVKSRLAKFVLVRLYINDRKPGARSAEWHAMLRERFGTSAIPLYVALSPADETLGTLAVRGGQTKESFAEDLAALLDDALARTAKR